MYEQDEKSRIIDTLVEKLYDLASRANERAYIAGENNSITAFWLKRANDEATNAFYEAYPYASEYTRTFLRNYNEGKKSFGLPSITMPNEHQEEAAS